MMSHGYYSVISPEGAAAIEGRLRGGGDRATPELIEFCASQLHITAEDNLKFGYIDKIIQEPVLGARPYHYDFSAPCARRSSGPRMKRFWLRAAACSGGCSCGD